MVKLICFIKRKPGLSREDFKRYYETRHVPLVLHLFPMFAHYSRSYVEPRALVELDHLDASLPEPDFDVATMIWFDGRAALSSFMALCADPAVGQKLAEDEEKFIDRSSIVSFEVDERQTPDDKLPFMRRADAHEFVKGSDKQLKMMVLLWRKPGLSREAFIDHYESVHAPLAIALQPPIFAGYTRNFIEPAGTVRAAHIESMPEMPCCDAVSEFWFASRNDFDRFVARCAEPEVGAQLLRDEEKLFDRPKMVLFMVDERISVSTA